MGESITRPSQPSHKETLPVPHLRGTRRAAHLRVVQARHRDPGKPAGSPGRPVHDAFVKAWDRWSSLRDPTRFDAWFRRIVVNTCRDQLREAKHRRLPISPITLPRSA